MYSKTSTLVLSFELLPKEFKDSLIFIFILFNILLFLIASKDLGSIVPLRTASDILINASSALYSIVFSKLVETPPSLLVSSTVYILLPWLSFASTIATI